MIGREVYIQPNLISIIVFMWNCYR